MDFYTAVQNRLTVRDFSEKELPREALERILNAGLQAPSHNHLREWEYVVLQTSQEKENALRYVAEKARTQGANKYAQGQASPQQQMYAYAMPRQHTMLAGAPCVVLPFFKASSGVMRPSSVSSLNSFASVWCLIENIFLAATAEGLACSMRIPVGEEGPQVAAAVGAPEGYMLPCYIGLGYAAPGSPKLEQQPYSLQQKMHYGTW